MPLSSPSPRKKRRQTGEASVQKLVSRRRKVGPHVDSSCDENLDLSTSCAEKMPGMKHAEVSSLSHSSFSQSSIRPSGESLTSSWSPTSASPSASPAPNEMSPNSPLTVVQPPSSGHELRSEERGLYLIQLLLACAMAVANNNMEYTNIFLEQLSSLASLMGDPMQRVATYFMEGLAARSTRSWPGVYKALHSTQHPSIVELLSARHVFFSVCPYLKFAFLTVNQAILDAIEGEQMVHVIDLQASDAVQWLALLQALRVRPGGPPRLKITGISERREVLQQLAGRLSEEADRLNIVFHFVPLVSKLEKVTVNMLQLEAGEVVAVSSVMRLHLLVNDERISNFNCADGCGKDTDGQNKDMNRAGGNFESVGGGAFEKLDSGERRSETASCDHKKVGGTKKGRGEAEEKRGHGTPVREVAACLVCQGGENSAERSEVLSRGRDFSASTGSHCGRGLGYESDESAVMERVLRMLRSLSPKVMVVVEQESNHNSPTLLERFVEALHYYCALFDSLDSTLPQQCLERVTLEKHLFGVEIKNIVSCEGPERVERHEKLDKWRKTLDRAGFVPLPLSYSTIIQAKRLLSSNSCDGYRLLEDGGCLTLCWQDTPLFTGSAWHT